MSTYTVILNESLRVGEAAKGRPYIPSFAASSELLGEPKVATEPGVHVANGRLLGASNGGVIQIGSAMLGLDLVAAASDGRVMELSPTDKTCVRVDAPEHGVGAIQGEGMVVLSDHDTALLVIAGIVTACRWTAEDARSRGARVTQVKDYWVIQPDFANRAEVTDVHASGEVRARLLAS